VKRLGALALLVGTAALGQAQPEAPLDWLHGDWRGTGTMFGRPSQVSLKVAPAFDGRAATSEYRVEVPADAARPAIRFEGRGFYRIAADGKVSGQWNDSAGNHHPLAGRIAGTVLTVNWGEPRTELGFSRYALEPDGTLAVTDGVYNRGEARVFAEASYRRN
jgi:hypothetical protein